MVEADIKRAVELLRDMRRANKFDTKAAHIDIDRVIALLEPQPLSKNERIAAELDKLEEYFYFDKSTTSVPGSIVRNIAAILREKP